jgi:hypothetical protein
MPERGQRGVARHARPVVSVPVRALHIADVCLLDVPPRSSMLVQRISAWKHAGSTQSQLTVLASLVDCSLCTPTGFTACQHTDCLCICAVCCCNTGWIHWLQGCRQQSRPWKSCQSAQPQQPRPPGLWWPAAEEVRNWGYAELLCCTGSSESPLCQPHVIHSVMGGRGVLTGAAAAWKLLLADGQPVLV